MLYESRHKGSSLPTASYHRECHGSSLAVFHLEELPWTPRIAIPHKQLEHIVTNDTVIIVIMTFPTSGSWMETPLSSTAVVIKTFGITRCATAKVRITWLVICISKTSAFIIKTSLLSRFPCVINFFLKSSAFCLSSIKTIDFLSELAILVANVSTSYT